MDIAYTNEQLVDNYALGLMKGIITANYDSDRKLMQQNLQLADQAFLKIKRDMMTRNHMSESGNFTRRSNRPISANFIAEK